MSDSETLDASTKKIRKVSRKKIAEPDTEDDFPSMFVELCRRTNLRVSFFLFIIGVFILSDVFMENVLTPWGGVDIDCPNTKGSMIQLICIVLSYIVIDLLVQGGLL
jgi:hypothetical protein